MSLHDISEGEKLTDWTFVEIIATLTRLSEPIEDRTIVSKIVCKGDTAESAAKLQEAVRSVLLQM